MPSTKTQKGLKLLTFRVEIESHKLRNKKGAYRCKTLANANVLTQIY